MYSQDRSQYPPPPLLRFSALLPGFYGRVFSTPCHTLLPDPYFSCGDPCPPFTGHFLSWLMILNLLLALFITQIDEVSPYFIVLGEVNTAFQFYPLSSSPYNARKKESDLFLVQLRSFLPPFTFVLLRSRFSFFFTRDKLI